MNRLILTLFVSCLWVGTFPALVAQDSSTAGDSDRSVRLELMKRFVQSLEVSQTIGTGEKRGEKVSLSPELVLIYSDAARDISDSAMWLWTRDGRPVAATAVEYRPHLPGERIWSFEFATLSARPVTMRQGEGNEWRIERPADVGREISSAPAPAEDARRRLQQMRQIARRFTVETYGPDGSRFAPRLMPTPAFRFPESRNSDGAVFVFAYGTNPEVLLLLELVEARDGLEWRYGLATLTATDVFVQLDGREVWKQPRYTGPQTRGVYLNGWFAPPDIKELDVKESGVKER